MKNDIEPEPSIRADESTSHGGGETTKAAESLPPWATQIFADHGIDGAAGPAVVLEKVGGMADRLAPDTRRLWKLILLLQGLAVLAPLLWLTVVRAGVPVSLAAVSMAVCSLIVVGVCWWLRWRGMQMAWVNARVVAEIARSAVASNRVAGDATIRALEGSSGLQEIARRLSAACPELDPVAGKVEYLKTRVDDQLRYYSEKLEDAMKVRKHLSRNVTRALDGTLFLAVAGVALSIHPGAERWLRLSGSDLVLGGLGVALPLIAILTQLLGSYLELNRRTGRYAQQVDFLNIAKPKLVTATTAEAVRKVVVDVERELLGEVSEWFYQMVYMEPYYRAVRSGAQASPFKNKATERSWAGRSWTWLGIGTSFVGRVIFGRLLIAGLSVVMTTALIAFYVPKDSVETSRLRREDGRLLSSPSADSWKPDRDRVENGFILIAHGLGRLA